MTLFLRGAQRPGPAELRLFAVALLALFGSCADGAPPPNVILVTLDTVRADALSCYDPEAGPTPNLDALAAEGVRFERVMSSSAVTPVAHATILTGKYQFHHGVRVMSAEGGFRIAPGEATLAARLKAEGYRTLAVHSAFPVSSYFGFGRDFDHFESVEGSFAEGEWDQKAWQRRSDTTTDLALKALQDVKQPFFLWIHYWDPHDPILLPPPKWLQDVRADATGALERTAENLDRIYQGEMRFQDRHFGRLLEGLRERSLAGDTLIAVTADHGQGLTDGEQRHGWRSHRIVYQEQLHVPLILAGPGLPQGAVVEALGRTADIAPTLYDYLGLPEVAGLDGRSLRELIEQQPAEPRGFYADQVNGYDWNAKLVDQRPESTFLYCISDGRWKLTYRPHMPADSELFDLQSDPLEANNLVQQQRAIYLDLMESLAELEPWVTAPFPADAEGFANLDEGLEGLGYLGGNEPFPASWEWWCPEHEQHRAPQPGSGRHEECGRRLVPVVAQ